MNKVVIILLAVISLFAVAPCRAGGYCAIAYSTCTCRYGFGDGFNSRRAAERTALNGCGAADAQIVGWGHNDYVALARGSGSAWGSGVGSTRRSAECEALANCPSRNAFIVKWVYSRD
jgi:hypothetical protein